MTEHRIMDDLRRAETMLSQLQTKIIERDEHETVSDVVNYSDELTHVIFLLSRIGYDVQWRSERGILHRETNASTSNPDDINAPR